MKTIFRYTNIAVIMAAFMAFGAGAVLAQDPTPTPAAGGPCEDKAGQDAVYSKFLEQFKVKTIEGRQAYIATEKEYLSKYGSCTSNADVKTNLDYITASIPKQEKALKDLIEQRDKDALAVRFNDGFKAKKWDDVYAAGKELLTRWPDEYRPVEIVLGSIAGEEALSSATYVTNPASVKYADETIKYAKMSVADLEAGKEFKLGSDVSYGLFNFKSPNKDDALGYLNLYIGYLTYFGKKDKVGSLPYLYKSTQAASKAAQLSVAYDLVGSYYFDQLKDVTTQIQTKAADQKDSDPPDVAQKKVDEIKALVAMSNGIAEREMDAYSRAYSLTKDVATQERFKKNIEIAYNIRFGKKEPVDPYIKSAIAKPFPNPTTPITPISDPEPVKTDATTTTPPAGTKPATTPPAPTAKPATTPAKPATTPPVKPASTAKPQATTKKPVVKKKAA